MTKTNRRTIRYAVLIGLYCGLLSIICYGIWHDFTSALIAFNLVSAGGATAVYLAINLWRWSERWIEDGSEK